jgi:hypothetical protein
MEILILAIVYVVCIALNSVSIWFILKGRKLSLSDLYTVVVCILVGPLGTFMILFSVVIAFVVVVGKCGFERLADYINKKRGFK